MARTVNTPINIPGECKGGGQIIGNDGGTRLSWQELAEAVNSCLNHKAPVLVCDAHAPDERWMGQSYPTGTSYKHRYKFPTPYRGLNNITYRAVVYLRGNRPTANAGASTTWELSYSVNGAGAVNVEVNAGTLEADFVWKLADLALDYTADYTTFDIWVKTFGAAMGTDSAIYCLEIKWYAGFSALPLGLYNLSDYPVPIFALDSAVLADADKPLSAGLIQVMAALLEFCYERAMPVFISSSISYNTTSPYIDQLMENPSSVSYVVFAQVRVVLPAGCPGVKVWAYMLDAKGGSSVIRLTAGGNVGSDTGLSTGFWETTEVDCRSGDVVTFDALYVDIGTIMIFARPAVLE